MSKLCVNYKASVGNNRFVKERMSGHGTYFADDEDSSEDKIPPLESVKFSGNQDDSKSNVTSAFSSSFHANEEEFFTSTTPSDRTNTHSKGSASKSKKESASKTGTESSGVSCEDLVIVLEESKFLKVLEDVVKELVEKLVTEKVSNRNSAASQNQLSVSRSKGSNAIDIKKTFEKRVKDFTESQKNLDPGQQKHGRVEQKWDDENLTSHSSQPRSSKTPSEPTQDKTPQPKPKVNKEDASGAKVSSTSRSNRLDGKASSAPSRKAGTESNVKQEPKPVVKQVCYFKSKSSGSRKSSRKDKGLHHGDEACKIICRTYMKPHPDDVKKQNMKIANALFSATFSLIMKKIKKEDSLAEKIGIALCGPRQCFEECSSEDKMEIVEYESPDADSNAQNRGQFKSTAKSRAVLPRLYSSQSSKRSHQSSDCLKHCVDASTNVRSRLTVLPKL